MTRVLEVGDCAVAACLRHVWIKGHHAVDRLEQLQPALFLVCLLTESLEIFAETPKLLAQHTLGMPSPQPRQLLLNLVLPLGHLLKLLLVLLPLAVPLCGGTTILSNGLYFLLEPLMLLNGLVALFARGLQLKLETLRICPTSSKL